MTHAVRTHTTGGPECLQWEEIGPADAAQAHRDLEARKTIGSTLPMP